MQTIGAEDLREVQRRMQRLEKPLWIGRPDRVRFAVDRGTVIFLAGIFWSAAFVTAAQWGLFTYPPISLVAKLPFIASALFMLSSPVREYLRARKLLYVVTNQRVLILDRLWRRSDISLLPAEIGPLEVYLRADGAGSIIFAQYGRPLLDGGAPVTTIGFKCIQQVGMVEAHIMRLKRTAWGE